MLNIVVFIFYFAPNRMFNFRQLKLSVLILLFGYSYKSKTGHMNLTVSVNFLSWSVSSVHLINGV